MKIEKEWIDSPSLTPTNAQHYWWVQVATDSRAGRLADALPAMLHWCTRHGYTLMSAFKGKDSAWRFKASRWWDSKQASADALKLADKVAKGLKKIEDMT